MNRYGVMARSHWARWLPQRYATISDPDSFFSTLGQETARQIDELAAELAGDDQPGEGYLEQGGPAGPRPAARRRRSSCRSRSCWHPSRRRARTRRRRPGAASGERPLVVDRSHPLWAEVNAEQQELAQDS